MLYLALGLALVFSILRLINFAYGELMTITGYILFFAIGAGLATPLVIVLGIEAAGSPPSQWSAWCSDRSVTRMRRHCC